MMEKIKPIHIAVIVIILFISSFSGCTVGSAEEEEPNVFIDLMKMIPAEFARNQDFILINNDKIWTDAEISFYQENGEKKDREEIVDLWHQKVTNYQEIQL